jgi:hypothetical protein
MLESKTNDIDIQGNLIASKVTPQVIVLGAEKDEVFEKALQDKGVDPTKLNQMVTIGTHSGPFHCDEVTACMMLLYTEQYKNALIVRTRNQE